MAGLATDPTTSQEGVLAQPSTLLHSVGGLVVLLVVQVLNVYKPQGLTPYGWRRQEEQRRASQASQTDQRRPGQVAPPSGDR